MYDNNNYQAEDDAYVISRYLEIMKDDDRIKKAHEILRKQVIELEERVKMIKKEVK